MTPVMDNSYVFSVRFCVRFQSERPSRRDSTRKAIDEPPLTKTPTSYQETEQCLASLRKCSAHNFPSVKSSSLSIRESLFEEVYTSGPAKMQTLC
ncbi:hypothetical protein CEXT_729171 [Caerostris extrusa]|uniref:Uncharacterized protein n=1 Tax=Caerostris extrusa TaxID=172846 RepID=A0AAV4PER5_CAEEX|nr:hypothetical protein CEXT_729171 [Caerostris extrusa]